MSLTYNDLLNLECCLQNAIYDLDGKIKELKSGKMTDNSVKERLEFNTKARDDYSALYKKLKQMERECDNDIRKSV